MRLFLYILIELVLLPWQLLATIVYSFRVWFKTNPVRISGTANEVAISRLVMHQAGTRSDEPTRRLIPHLPAFDPVVTWLFGSFGLASRWSGYIVSWAAYPVSRPSTFYSMIGQRTEFYDRLLTESIDPDGQQKVKQVVILGAGWDTRAWGILADSDVRIFEVDMPHTQQAKRAAVEASGLDVERVVFVESDLVEKTWLQVLIEQGFDPTLPSFILWEGVTTYLPIEAVNATLHEVGQLASGTGIAFDYISQEVLNAEPPFAKLGKAVGKGIKFYSNERFLSGVSTKPPARRHIELLVSAHGLELAEHELFGPEYKSFGGLVLAIRRN